MYLLILYYIFMLLIDLMLINLIIDRLKNNLILKEFILSYNYNKLNNMKNIIFHIKQKVFFHYYMIYFSN